MVGPIDLAPGDGIDNLGSNPEISQSIGCQHEPDLWRRVARGGVDIEPGVTRVGPTQPREQWESKMSSLQDAAAEREGTAIAGGLVWVAVA